MDIYNLDDVVTKSQLRSTIAAEIRKNSHVTNPKLELYAIIISDAGASLMEVETGFELDLKIAGSKPNAAVPTILFLKGGSPVVAAPLYTAPEPKVGVVGEADDDIVDAIRILLMVDC
ncbi:hypothetical protein REPUB_Repub13aG0133100 [Reevesia pubescens]